MKDVERRIDFTGSFIHPNYLHHILSSSNTDFNKDAQTEAIQLWQLCKMFPNIEAGVLNGIVTGKRKFTIDDEILIIHLENHTWLETKGDEEE